MTLYKQSDKKNYQLSDTNMVKMICHYFSPQVEVIDNKYITNIKCDIWSKHDDVNEFLDSYKSQILKNGLDPKIEITSFDDLYHLYKNYFNAKTKVDQKLYLIVSKQFFEKYLSNQLSEYVIFDKFVSSEWLLK